MRVYSSFFVEGTPKKKDRLSVGPNQKNLTVTTNGWPVDLRGVEGSTKVNLVSVFAHRGVSMLPLEFLEAERLSLRATCRRPANGEGSLIFEGAYRSRDQGLQNPEIRIA